MNNFCFFVEVGTRVVVLFILIWINYWIAFWLLRFVGSGTDPALITLPLLVCELKFFEEYTLKHLESS